MNSIYGKKSKRVRVAKMVNKLEKLKSKKYISKKIIQIIIDNLNDIVGKHFLEEKIIEKRLTLISVLRKVHIGSNKSLTKQEKEFIKEINNNEYNKDEILFMLKYISNSIDIDTLKMLSKKLDTIAVKFNNNNKIFTKKLFREFNACKI